MTGTYDWNPMPHFVDVRCPSCSARATFEFAEVVKIRLKNDVPFFQKSKLFDYQLFQDSCGHRWHGAIFYAGLHAGSVAAIRSLPEGYTPENWAHSRYLYRSHGLDIGSVNCSSCGLIQKHDLDWPSDAFFSIQYKGQELWAFNQESAKDLRDFIADIARDIDDYKWRHFLLHIPSIFKKRGAREHVVKHLNRLLDY
ncbi:hypothetical protein CAI21_16765 [Alkalilimnicola ehrlichii]|uniref:hypothetical protein n=1 Tax=Alkalilimnicola ehrlichii TaxID=351052 RepID=UPI000E2E825D|nr:hypothetical protein [Alkalilimnicola ehrlichii]RFA26609.1 hypothetical protein CAI21_16765 [Alkalilimnicola ehrlichii]